MTDPTTTTTWSPHVPPNWKVRARLWICAIFLLLSGADYLLLRFCYDPGNPLLAMTGTAPLLTALAVLSALGSKVLLICLWRRLGWARYALGALLALSIAGFSLAMFFIFGGNLPRPSGMMKKPVLAMALQAMALVPLSYSRSIRRQMNPMTGRD